MNRIERDLMITAILGQHLFYALNFRQSIRNNERDILYDS